MYNEFNLVEVGGSLDNNNFKRNIMCSPKEVLDKAKEYKLKDTYSTIYRYNIPNQDLSNVIAPFYIDLDIDDIEKDYDKLKRDLFLIHRQLKNKLHLKDEDIEIFFSGSKGFHLLINEQILGVDPCKNLNDMYKLLALRLKGYTITKCVDTKIYDKKRLFRVANTINYKTGLYKVPITMELLKQYNYEQLKQYASEAKIIKGIKIYKHNPQATEAFYDWVKEIQEIEKQSINYKAAGEYLKRKELLPCVKYILKNGSTQGGRNNTTNALASALFQIGKEYDEVLDIMQAWNDTKNEPPLPKREVEVTTTSAYKSVQAGKRYG